MKSIFDRVIDAIEKQEGYKPGTRAWKNNNPGNLKYGPFARSMGATGRDDQNHAIFPTVVHGRKALRKLIRIKFNGMTLFEIGRRYAEDPKWATGVSAISGVRGDEPIIYERTTMAAPSS